MLAVQSQRQRGKDVQSTLEILNVLIVISLVIQSTLIGAIQTTSINVSVTMGKTFVYQLKYEFETI